MMQPANHAETARMQPPQPRIWRRLGDGRRRETKAAEELRRALLDHLHGQPTATEAGMIGIAVRLQLDISGRERAGTPPDHRALLLLNRVLRLLGMQKPAGRERPHG